MPFILLLTGGWGGRGHPPFFWGGAGQGAPPTAGEMKAALVTGVITMHCNEDSGHPSQKNPFYFNQQEVTQGVDFLSDTGIRRESIWTCPASPRGGGQRLEACSNAECLLQAFHQPGQRRAGRSAQAAQHLAPPWLEVGPGPPTALAQDLARSSGASQDVENRGLLETLWHPSQHCGLIISDFLKLRVKNTRFWSNCLARLIEG